MSELVPIDVSAEACAERITESESPYRCLIQQIELADTLRTALANTLWMAREWMEHSGSSAMNGDEYEAYIECADKALAQWDSHRMAETRSGSVHDWPGPRDSGDALCPCAVCTEAREANAPKQRCAFCSDVFCACDEADVPRP